LILFKDQINKIAGDKLHGSSELLHQIISTISEFEGRVTSQELKWAFGQLEKIDRSMSVVHHFIKTLSPFIKHEFYVRLNEYQKKWGSIEKQLSFNLMSAFDLRNKKILTHSHSRTVQTVVGRLKEENVEIIQTESNPGGEGILQARQLGSKGIRVKLIADEKAQKIIGTIDLCLFGCDQFTERAFVNKVGTKSIADTAAFINKPVVILSDSRKQVKNLELGSEIFEIVSFDKNMKLIIENDTKKIDLF
jgi:methylthioribose-1-phosphate isomerase